MRRRYSFLNVVGGGGDNSNSAKVSVLQRHPVQTEKAIIL